MLDWFVGVKCYYVGWYYCVGVGGVWVLFVLIVVYLLV